MDAPQLTVGEFSRLTHLTVKTLHHYHEVGVLTPADVDPVTGYRRYALDQVEPALLVRRLRGVGMPVPQVRAVLAADDARRQALIAAHLDDLRHELARTAAAVTDLQTLLTGDARTVVITIRDVPDLPCVLATEDVARDDITAWCAATYPRLFAAAGRLGGAGGPAGALYPGPWFADGGGRVTAFVPLAGPRPGADVVPGSRYAVALHAGPFTDLDRTYAALGADVAAHGTGTDDPVREIYLITPGDVTDPAGLRTEVCWPLTPQGRQDTGKDPSCP
jgi:DNA-binding transcriptional MerR regulator